MGPASAQIMVTEVRAKYAWRVLAFRAGFFNIKIMIAHCV